MLTKPRKDGSTLYEHLSQACKSDADWPVEYAPPAPPIEADYLWDLFWELRSTCGQGSGMGPTRMSYLELDAWMRVTGLELNHLELKCLFAMDTAFLEEFLK